MDDLGNEAFSQYSVSNLLFPIIDYRIRYRKTTLISSNYDLNELGSVYTNPNTKNSVEPKKIAPIISRLKGNEMFDVVEFNSKNFRLEK